MDGISTKTTSVIMTHWAMNDFRSGVMRASVESLLATAPNAEIIVVDNGDNLEDSEWLLKKTNNGQIACYIRNRKNMSFGWGRNQALKLCSGDYIVISDNDILFEKDWLERCIEFLEKHEGKYLATPMAVDFIHNVPKYYQGEIDGWKLNMRAGSNCWVMRRKDFEQIGFFDIHNIAGTKYTDRYVGLGYLMAVMPKPKVFDMAFRGGYELYKPLENLEL